MQNRESSFCTVVVVVTATVKDGKHKLKNSEDVDPLAAWHTIVKDIPFQTKEVGLMHLEIHCFSCFHWLGGNVQH